MQAILVEQEDEKVDRACNEGEKTRNCEVLLPPGGERGGLADRPRRRAEALKLGPWGGRGLWVGGILRRERRAGGVGSVIAAFARTSSARSAISQGLREVFDLEQAFSDGNYIAVMEEGGVGDHNSVNAGAPLTLLVLQDQRAIAYDADGGMGARDVGISQADGGGGIAANDESLGWVGAEVDGAVGLKLTGRVVFDRLVQVQPRCGPRWRGDGPGVAGSWQGLVVAGGREGGEQLNSGGIYYVTPPERSEGRAPPSKDCNILLTPSDHRCPRERGAGCS